MYEFLIKLLLVARAGLRSRARLEAENIVLRQQVIVLSRKARSRLRLRNTDRLILVWMYRLFPSILNVITVVKPETLIRWHRRGFRACWHWKSSPVGGRPKIDRDIRDLILYRSATQPSDPVLAATHQRHSPDRVFGSHSGIGGQAQKRPIARSLSMPATPRRPVSNL